MGKSKGIVIVMTFLIVGGIGAWVINYLALGKPSVLPGRVEILKNENIKMPLISEGVSVPYKVEVFVENLFVPWSFVFTSDKRLLVAQRNGEIKEIIDGGVQDESLIKFEEVSNEAEEGLMGIAIDPKYSENKHLYVCIAYPSENGLFDKVIRLIDGEKSIEEDIVILDGIPAAKFHAGCRLRFGPDEKLYITTGDATNKDFPQDTTSLAGKILRINSDGSIPEDNPHTDSPVWSYGHRNPQGIDWNEEGIMYETEHGPSVFDGPAGGDEVNLIVKGGNYGWPVVSHENSKVGMIDPQMLFTPAVAPASGMFYTSDVFPQFKGNFIFGALRGEGIIRVITSEEDPEDIIAFEKLQGIDYGRIRDVVQGPDGYIYFSTSNLDGRGEPNQGDDKILRIAPINE